MGKVKTTRTRERTDAGYIRKLCHVNHPGFNISQSALDDLDLLADELFDQLAREAAELLQLNTPKKSTLTVREMDHNARLNFDPELYRQVSAAARDAVLSYASSVKSEAKAT